jgi:hypothetical protein
MLLTVDCLLAAVPQDTRLQENISSALVPAAANPARETIIFPEKVLKPSQCLDNIEALDTDTNSH